MRSQASHRPRAGRSPGGPTRSEPQASEVPRAGRNEQLVRLLQILRDLDRFRGQTIDEIAERYGTSRKTVRRDLDAIEAAGLPLECERDGSRKLWRLEFKDKLRQLSSLLDASHYLALRVAMEPGAPMKNDSSVFARLEDLGQKIEAAIGEAGRAQLEAIEACFYPYEKRTYKESPPDVLWPLVEAISARRLCRVTYRAPRVDAADKTFEVLPLKLFAYEGTLYLMCHVPKHGTLATLNLQRLRKLRLLEKRGRAPADFDPETLEHAAFGVFVGGAETSYRLRFTPEIAPYIRERAWHPTQKLRDLPDGGVELAFRCHASYEVGAWVQSWGRGVEVIEPKSLRAELAALGAWLRGAYERRGESPA
jgi:proteasome accessory factor B